MPFSITLGFLFSGSLSFSTFCITSALFSKCVRSYGASSPAPDLSQVWSLTQFYSVDFSKSRIGVNKCVLNQGQARGIWTYHLLKFEIWLYHEGPTLQSRITQKWLELSLSFFHIMKIWNICGHLQLV